MTKLENCGRCGLEPTTWKDADGARARCLAHPEFTTGPCHDAVIRNAWNAAQFAARTERINAAAVVVFAAGAMSDDAVPAAILLINKQDAAARVRWAEMQKGE